MINSWEYLAKGTIAALDAVISRYYADCYNTEEDMHRLMLWKQKLKTKLIQEAVKKAPPERKNEKH